MKSAATSTILTVAASLVLGVAAHAASLTSGFATIDYDKAAWDTLASGFGAGPQILTLDSYFDQAATNARTASQIQTGPAIPGSSYTGEIYAMNGPTVMNLAGRTTQPTDFDFTPGSPQTGTGRIGLGGIARFAVSPIVGGGVLLFGDFTLQYDTARLSLGGTGWYLKGNIIPTGAAFDILNVNIVETPGSLTISGDLSVSFEVANLLYNTPADAGKDVGNFTFTGSVVPEPSICLLSLAGLVGIAGFRRRSELTR